MQHEGEVVLPQVLAAAGVRRALLVGHSDGASIALIYAGAHPASDIELLGLVLEAPHVFCEELSVKSIARAREEFEQGDLRERLTRHHGANVDVAFRGWNDAWLDPGFRAWNLESYLPRIRCPVLVIQGADDPYGTLRQVETITREVAGPAEALVLNACGHTPHRDQRAKTLEAMADASRRWLATRSKSR
jgi:pimeloyl-ACP methyl ester carboxylesterase